MTDAPRLLCPDRQQYVFEEACLDRQLPPEHRARQVWAFVERLDVTALEERVRSRAGVPGAPAISPRLLLGLWVYATLDGEGSAREVARRCEEHIAYRWLCGGVGVNHHTLSDFRGSMGAFLDGLLSDVIAVLVKAGVVDGSTIHQDGTKVRASAGRGSFRRESSLQRLRREAMEHVAKIKSQAEDPALNSRVRAARERAARERQERVDAAISVMQEINRERSRPGAKKRPDRTAEPRASTTDADARVMKTGSGGTRPAYNVQIATDGKSRAVVGLRVTSDPVDYGLSEPMRAEVEQRTGVKVTTHVTDAGYLNKEAVEREESAGVTRILPLPMDKRGEPCTAHQPSDGPGVRAWRERMQTDEAKALLKQRPGVAETPNAELKTHRGLDRMLVRGLPKVTGVILLGAVVYNFVHFAATLIGRPLIPT